MEDLSPEAKAAVDALRETETPSAGALSDGLSRLEAQVGPGLNTPLAEGGGGLTPLAKLLVGGLAAGALVAGYFLMRPPEPAPSPSPTAVATPSVAPTPTAKPPPPVSFEPKPPPPSVDPGPPPPPPDEQLAPEEEAPKAAPKPAKTDEGSNLEEELRLIRSAGTATNAGDHRTALELLAEHKRRFPRGVLRGERELTRAKTTCAMGNKEDARKIADRFVRRHPKSHLRSRFETICK